MTIPSSKCRCFLIITLCLFAFIAEGCQAPPTHSTECDSCFSTAALERESNLRNMEDIFWSALVREELLEPTGDAFFSIEASGSVDDDTFFLGYFHGWDKNKGMQEERYLGLLRQGLMHVIPRGRTEKGSSPGGLMVLEFWAAGRTIDDVTAQRAISRAIIDHVIAAEPRSPALDSEFPSTQSRFFTETGLLLPFGYPSFPPTTEPPYSLDNRKISVNWTGGRVTSIHQALPSSFSPAQEAAKVSQYEDLHPSLRIHYSLDLFTMLRYSGPLANRTRDGWVTFIATHAPNDWFFGEAPISFDCASWSDRGEGIVELDIPINRKDCVYPQVGISVQWESGQLIALTYYLNKK